MQSPAPLERTPSDLRRMALLALSSTLASPPEHHRACFTSLPPKLRRAILQFATNPSSEPLVLGWSCHESYLKDAVALFLTSKQMYADAAPIFYDQVEISGQSFGGLAERFFTGTLSPRRWVRRLSIRFQIKDELSLCETLFPAPVRSMLEQGRLQELEVTIGTKKPHKTPFGYPPRDNFAKARLRIGEDADQELASGFVFVTEAPFQALLRLLDDPRFKTVMVRIEAMFHLELWCPFHEKDDETECDLYDGFRFLCREDFSGDMPRLVIDWKRVVETFLGAKVLKRQRRK